MQESLSIRAYDPLIRSHTHDFHQIVVPLRGAIEINVDNLAGIVGVGHCVIIWKGSEHAFVATRHARFLVADLDKLPQLARSSHSPFATVSNAFKSFCQFADIQIRSQQNSAIEGSMIAVFKDLLSLQEFLPEIDARISRSLVYIEKNLSSDCSLATLSNVASMSVSQFKSLFKKYTGKTLGQHLLTIRMEQARAQLINTDMPISIVADTVGYSNASAFSRAFENYHGTSPREYKKKRRIRTSELQSK